MYKLRENLYVGNARDATLIEELRKAKITAVLNVSYETDDPIYHPNEIRYVKVGLTDSSDNKKEMRQLAIIVLAQLLDDGETVLVHCGAGLSRAPFVACQTLYVLENKDPNDILQELRNMSPFVQKGILWLGFGYIPEGIEE